jgi:protein AroM
MRAVRRLPMSHSPRAAFVTIGQTPRVDLVPEMRTWIGDGMAIEEFGALDGLSRAEVDAMAPGPDDHRLVTRLADGTEVVVRKDLMHRRLQRLFDDIGARPLFCTVLLCTGHFPPFDVDGLFLDAQSIVDHSVAALAGHARLIGVMVPLRQQIAELHVRPGAGQTMKVSDASPYAAGRLEQAAAAVADADVIVMHCMGYTDAMRRTVAGITGRPVLLARRLVAAALGQLV